MLSGSYDNTLKLWEEATGQLVRTFKGHKGGVNSVAFSPDGRRVLSGGGGGFFGPILRLWDVETGRLVRTFKGHGVPVYSVAFSPDGRRVLSGSGSPTILERSTLKLWEVATGRPVRFGALRQETVEAPPRDAPIPAAAATAPQAPDLEPLDEDYVALRNTNVRARPEVTSDRLARIAKGQMVTALGRVKGTNWMLVARDGKRLGYVYGPRLRPAESAAEAAAPARPPAAFGRYHALVIGNDAYTRVPRLRTAVSDATAVGAALERQYGYEVTVLRNATRDDMVGALDTFRRRLAPNDNLLVYYAGHGVLDESSGQGYWLGVDADRDSVVKWVSNATVTDTLRAMKAKHVMVVADSCYSGTLTRGIKVVKRERDYFKRIAGIRTRVALTSGGLEPVEAGQGGHSVFARAFLAALRQNTSILDGMALFNALDRRVRLDTDQTPAYGDIKRAGHEGGDFLFVRPK